MKSAGVSFTAAAIPIPTPAHRARPLASSHASASTRASSRMLTWPKLKVSRSGSNSASAQAPRTQPYQPWPRQPGPTRMRSTAARATRSSSRATTIVARRPSRDIGSMASAAKGG